LTIERPRLKRLLFRTREELKLQLLASVLVCLGISCGSFFFFRFAVESFRLSRYDGKAAEAKLAEMKRDFQSRVSEEGLYSSDAASIRRWARESGAAVVPGGEKPASDDLTVGFAPEGPALSLSTVIRYRDGEVGTRFLHLPLRSLRFVSWVVALLLAFDVFLLSLFFILKKKLDYVLKIERGLSALESGELDHEIPVEGADELARLAASVNLLARSIRDRIDSEQKALQANREIIGDLSHDIRTPLTVGMGYLTLLLERENLSEGERRDYLLLALKKAEQIKERTRALLEFATLASGQLTVRKTVLDIRVLTNQLREELSALAELRVQDGIPEGAIDGRIVCGDAGLLERLFDNLLSNLQKHGDTSRPVHFRVRLEDGSVRIEIENAVSGRPRAESSSLGLKICACILDLHGGRFETAQEGDAYRTRIFLPVR
jgi:signal transduction histidine kinase